MRPRARLDLLEQFLYFAEKENLVLAKRYLAAVEETCRRLRQRPRSGAPYRSSKTELRGVRHAAVDGFRRYLIFYLPAPNQIEVIRVLHGSRNLVALLAEDEM